MTRRHLDFVNKYKLPEIVKVKKETNIKKSSTKKSSTKK